MINSNLLFEEPPFDYEMQKRAFIDNMDMLKNMTVEEQTLYKKHVEIQEYSEEINRAQIIKTKIWKPTNIFDKELTIKEIEALEPTIQHVSTKEEQFVWLMLRVFVHSMSFDQNPGRFLKFLVIDKVTRKYLGFTSIGSDVISISCRDEWIGWDYDTKEKKLINSAIGTTIASTQPLGYNFLGGKLCAALLTTENVYSAWERVYGDKLAGITTTSLYGSHSMYQRIPWWKELGKTNGKINIKPDDVYYKIWHDWIKQNRADEYKIKIIDSGPSKGPVTGIKQKILQIIFKELGIKYNQYEHGFERGVYYAPLYENTKEFLLGKISEDGLIPLKNINSEKNVIAWWKAKAITRYTKLIDDNRLKPEILYYANGINTTWNEFKTKYFNEVGR